MKSPIRSRNNIPFFYNKSEKEFKKDAYERYDSMVNRQTALHLADEIWGGYPIQAVLDFASPHLPDEAKPYILEIGCSTGRMIATLARLIPSASCWGLDYSYQMLKRADEYWVQGDAIYLDFRKQGFPKMLELQTDPIANLQFGLSKASDLPFADHSQDFLLHSFLLDRLDDPEAALREMYRVMKPFGKMVFITPLNFLQTEHWEKYFPPIKIYQLITDIGFNILDWHDDFMVKEPMDLRGNAVQWNCIAVVVEKKGS